MYFHPGVVHARLFNTSKHVHKISQAFRGAGRIPFPRRVWILSFYFLTFGENMWFAFDGRSQAHFWEHSDWPFHTPKG